MKKCCSISGFLSLCVLLFSNLPASAAPFYSYSYQPYSGFFSGSNTTTGIDFSQSTSKVFSGTTLSGSASIQASAGNLDVSANAGVVIGGTSVPATSNRNASTFSTGVFRFDDVIITNVSDPTKVENVLASMNFSLAGDYAVGGSTNNGSYVKVEVNQQFGSYLVSGGISSNPAYNPSDMGIFAGVTSLADIAGAYTTKTGSLLTTVPLSIGLDLAVSTWARSSYLYNSTSRNYYGDGFASAAYDIWLPHGATVFNLPAGYVANSADGLIVNNRWMGGTPVPVPGALSLLGFGLAGLLRLRHRRDSR